MKRLLIAAFLALGIHGLLLASRPDWITSPKRPAWQPGTVTVTLSYREGKPDRSDRAPAPLPTISQLTEEQPPPGPKEKRIEVAREAVSDKPGKTVPKKSILESTDEPKPRTTRPVDIPIQPRKALSPESAADSDRTSARSSAGGFSAAETKKPGISFPKENLMDTGRIRESGRSVSRRGNEVLRESEPLYRENPPPSYPAVARRRGYEGTVLLEVLVDERGRVADLRVAESSGHAVLDNAAVRSVRRWRFEPAMRGKETVSTWVRVPIRFQLQ